MSKLIFDAELRTVPPQFCHLTFAQDTNEAVVNNIYQHADTDKVINQWSIDGVLEAMDKAGVTAGLLSGLPWQDEGLHKEHNAYIDECLHNDPKRFKGLYMAYAQNPEQAAENILALDTRFYSGVEIIPKWQNCHIDDAALEPIYQAIQKKGLFLKAYTAHITQTLDGDSPYRLLQLLKSYPDMKVLSPHLGGLLCLYALMPGIKELLSNTYFISSVTATMPMLKYAVDVNPNNILFGTDFPFNHCHDILSPLKELEQFQLEPDIQHKVLWANAAEIFGLHA